jgi:hypothetical protein
MGKEIMEDTDKLADEQWVISMNLWLTGVFRVINFTNSGDDNDENDDGDSNGDSNSFRDGNGNESDRSRRK